MVDQTNHDGRPDTGRDAAIGGARSDVVALFDRTPKSENGSDFRIGLMCEAFVAANARRHKLAMEGLLQSDLTEERILTGLIPATARRMGDHWLADRLSFAEVTIGSARLQQVLHAHTRSRRYPTQQQAHRILMIVPLNEQHTLGAHVAAHIWRDKGVHVEMALGMTPAQIALRVRRNRFSAVCISVSARRNLAQAQVVVESIKAVTRSNLTIFVGGSVTALDCDIKALTGCDVVSSDPAVVLRESSAVVVPTQL